MPREQRAVGLPGGLQGLGRIVEEIDAARYARTVCKQVERGAACYIALSLGDAVRGDKPADR